MARKCFAYHLDLKSERSGYSEKTPMGKYCGFTSGGSFDVIIRLVCGCAEMRHARMQKTQAEATERTASKIQHANRWIVADSSKSRPFRPIIEHRCGTAVECKDGAGGVGFAAHLAHAVACCAFGGHGGAGDDAHLCGCSVICAQTRQRSRRIGG